MNDKEILEKIDNLIEILNYHTELYEKGCPVISDQEWDNMYFELQRLENLYGIYQPNSPTQQIKYQLVSELKKVKHNVTKKQLFT